MFLRTVCMHTPDSRSNPDEDDGDHAATHISFAQVKGALFRALAEQTPHTVNLAGDPSRCIQMSVEAEEGKNEGDDPELHLSMELLVGQKITERITGLGEVRSSVEDVLTLEMGVVKRIVASLTRDFRQAYLRTVFDPHIEKMVQQLEEEHCWEKIGPLQSAAWALRHELLHADADTYTDFSGTTIPQSVPDIAIDPSIPPYPDVEVIDAAMEMLTVKIIRRLSRKNKNCASALTDYTLSPGMLSVRPTKGGHLSLMMEYDTQSLGHIDDLIFISTSDRYTIHPDIVADIVNRMKKDAQEEAARSTIACYVLHSLMDKIRMHANKEVPPEGKPLTVQDAKGFYQQILKGKLPLHKQTAEDFFIIEPGEEEK